MDRSIGLDTIILARYYVESAEDDLATTRQRALSQKLLESGKPLRVAKTVLLELEWVLRGYYQLDREEVSAVFQHLMSLAHVSIEDQDVVERALDHHAAGLDFADALHHASYADCASLASFDDRGFAKRVKRLNVAPTVVVPR